jgi:hypothetical protein
MLGEMVSDEYVEQVGVAAQVRLRQCDQLSVTGRGRVLGSSSQDVEVGREQGSGHQKRRRGRVFGAFENLGGRVGMVPDQSVDEGCDVIGHTCTVGFAADGTLTMLTPPPAEGQLP